MPKETCCDITKAIGVYERGVLAHIPSPSRPKAAANERFQRLPRNTLQT